MSNLQTANTILAQLGGTGRLSAMLGAKNFLGDENSVQFRIGRGAAGGINSIKVTLDPSDTYTVEFVKVGRAPNFKITTVASVDGVYCDSLKSTIEQHTRMYLSL